MLAMLLSIKPIFVEEILAEHKQFEFRKSVVVQMWRALYFMRFLR